MTNAAYLQTSHVTHIVTWAQSEKHTYPSGRNWYPLELVTMCGRKKDYLKSSKLRYPDYTDMADVQSKPLCKLCEHVLQEASQLSKQLVSS